MLNNLQKRKEGFTIVEVMIVLAIAGLIILVVLLAVPALQRNSRNTTMKNDASAVAGLINESTSINNGKLPTNVASAADGTITATNTTETTGKVQGSTTVNTGTAAATAVGTITVVLAKKCSNDAPAAGATARSVAVTYVLETTSGTAAKCLDA